MRTGQELTTAEEVIAAQLEAGANPVLVAFRLGHTSTRMLEQHYAGRLDRADRELARALDAAAQMRHAAGSESAPTSPHSV